MLDTEQINDLHRLYWSERWSIRKIERHLRIGWRTIRKYLEAPAQGPALRSRSSKLDSFKGNIAEWLEKDPRVTAAVIEQRLRPLGYDGGSSILQEYVRKVRPQTAPRRAFVRMEPVAGERFEVDWGHFGALDYVGGVARQIAYDNLATAVAEHDGRIVRFHPRFLGFAREYSFYPHACNPGSGWEKGKVERAIGYLRQNFWPLREFTDLHDGNRQVRQWLSEVANRRMHSETRERPLDRFKPEALRPLPVIAYDYRGSTEALVHKDLRLPFDGNRYCVAHRYVGRRLTIKADSGSVAIYDRVEEVVSYARSWRRGQTFGADRFEKALADERPAARRSQAQQRLLDSLDGLCLRATVEAYLRDLGDPGRSLGRQIPELLERIRQYGPEDVADAIGKAAKARAYGADYVANILRQQRSPRRPQPPLRRRDPLLNELATDPISLLEYDTFILESGKEPDDPTRRETAAAEQEGDEPSDRGDDR